MNIHKNTYILYKKIFFVVVLFFSFHVTFALPCDFLQTSTILYPKTINNDVFELQKFLNLDPDTSVAKTGPGSPGEETKKYGEGTFFAVKRFQEKYAKEILWPIDLYEGTGVFGFSSKSKMYSLYCAKKENVAGIIPSYVSTTTVTAPKVLLADSPVDTESLSIVSPISSSFYKLGNTIPFDIRLTDATNISALALIRNGMLLRETPLLFAGVGGYTTSIDTVSLSEGLHTFTVIAKNGNGYVYASSSVLVNLVR